MLVDYTGHILEIWGSVRYWPERALSYDKKGTFCEKGHIFEKRAPKISPPSPYSIPFLSVLYQNKALYIFFKRGQRSIVEHNIGLENALLYKFIFP